MRHPLLSIMHASMQCHEFVLIIAVPLQYHKLHLLLFPSCSSPPLDSRTRVVCHLQILVVYQFVGVELHMIHYSSLKQLWIMTLRLFKSQLAYYDHQLQHELKSHMLHYYPLHELV